MAVACGDSTSGNKVSDGGGGEVAGRVQLFEGAPRDELDLLFMIDNSASMRAAQDNLITNFSTFMNVLRGLPRGLPSLHIGVVSSDLGAGGRTDLLNCRPMGDGGRLQSEPRIPGCLGPRDRYISATANETVKNYDGTLQEAFACIASLGETGCSFEHQLKSAAVALGFDGAIPAENAGFLRPEAHLAIIFLTDEDDCSAPADAALFDTGQRLLSDPLGPVSSYRCNEFGHLCQGQRPPRMPPSDGVTLDDCHSAEDGVLTRVSELAAFFKSLKPRAGMVTMTAITGPRAPYTVRLEPAFAGGAMVNIPGIVPSCMQNAGLSADPAVRIADFIDQFGISGVFLPLCAPTFEPALMRIAEEVGRVAPPRCLQADVVGGTASVPDLAADCQVFQHEPVAGGSTKLTALPKCGAEPPVSCWAISNSPNCNGGPILLVSWNGTPPEGEVVSVRCGSAR